MPLCHLIVFVPASHAASVRDAMAKAGAGRMGNYDSCTFSISGTGRFRPLKGANPRIGSAGKLEEVAEERIETVVAYRDLAAVLKAIRKAHPYEKPAIYVLPMVDFKKILQ